MDGINSLMKVSQMAVQNGTEANLLSHSTTTYGGRSEVKDSHDRYANLTKTEIGFDSYSRAISESFTGFQTARTRKQRWIQEAETCDDLATRP